MNCISELIQGLIKKTEEGQIGWRKSCIDEVCREEGGLYIYLGQSYNRRSEEYDYSFKIKESRTAASSLLYIITMFCKEYQDELHTLYTIASRCNELPDEDPALTAILDTSLKGIGLSVRAINALWYYCDARTIRDVVAIPRAEELRKIRGVGRVTIQEIEDFLAQRNLSFGMFNE
jgi:DNA-directed RNA polymerase alpha subunit